MFAEFFFDDHHHFGFDTILRSHRHAAIFDSAASRAVHARRFSVLLRHEHIGAATAAARNHLAFAFIHRIRSL